MATEHKRSIKGRSRSSLALIFFSPALLEGWGISYLLPPFSPPALLFVLITTRV